MVGEGTKANTFVSICVETDDGQTVGYEFYYWKLCPLLQLVDYDASDRAKAAAVALEVATTTDKDVVRESDDEDTDATFRDETDCFRVCCLVRVSPRQQALMASSTFRLRSITFAFLGSTKP